MTLTTPLTAEQRDVLNNLSESAAKCMRSKRLLRILDSLDDLGLIDFSPFAGRAALTAPGRAALTAKGDRP